MPAKRYSTGVIAPPFINMQSLPAFFQVFLDNIKEVLIIMHKESRHTVSDMPALLIIEMITNGMTCKALMLIHLMPFTAHTAYVIQCISTKHNKCHISVSCISPYLIFLIYLSRPSRYLNSYWL